MIAMVNEPGYQVYFYVHKDASYVKSCYGDTGFDDVEGEIVELPKEVIESETYQKTYKQLLRGLETLIVGKLDYEKLIVKHEYQ